MKCVRVKIYHLKRMYLGSASAGSFIYALFPPLAISKWKFDSRVSDCFISFGSVLEKQQQEKQNPDFVQKAIRLRKFFSLL